MGAWNIVAESFDSIWNPENYARSTHCERSRVTQFNDGTRDVLAFVLSASLAARIEAAVNIGRKKLSLEASCAEEMTELTTRLIAAKSLSKTLKFHIKIIKKKLKCCRVTDEGMKELAQLEEERYRNRADRKAIASAEKFVKKSLNDHEEACLQAWAGVEGELHVLWQQLAL